jgi:endonuclease YncB( thermonuclease family)
MPYRVLPLLVALIVVAWASSASADDFTGKVVGVSDGDTITVLRGRSPVKIRLHGIDSPRAARTSAPGLSRRPRSWRSGRS